MTSPQKVILWGAVVLAAIGCFLGIAALSTSKAPAPTDQTDQSDSSVQAGAVNGAVVQNAPYAFTNGLYIGGQKALTEGDVISISAGTNQAYWTNTHSQTAYLILGDVTMAGTASSTFWISVGTSTNRAVTDTYTPATSPAYAQFINAFQVATGTPAGVVADNISGYKSGTHPILAVPTGQSVFLIANSFCKLSGPCETATSSTRGWTTLSFPFYYRL